MSWEVCYKYRQNLLTAAATCRPLSRTYLWISSDLLTETSMTLTAAMRPRFSIEWMAQSSQPAEPETSTASGPLTWGTRSETPCTEPEICKTTGPAAWGTRSETLPGFYYRQKSEGLVQVEHRGLVDTFRPNNLPQTSTCGQGNDVKSDYYLFYFIFVCFCEVFVISKYLTCSRQQFEQSEPEKVRLCLILRLSLDSYTTRFKHQNHKLGSFKVFYFTQKQPLSIKYRTE